MGPGPGLPLSVGARDEGLPQVENAGEVGALPASGDPHTSVVGAGLPSMLESARPCARLIQARQAGPLPPPGVAPRPATLPPAGGGVLMGECLNPPAATAGAAEGDAAAAMGDDGWDTLSDIDRRRADSMTAASSRLGQPCLPLGVSCTPCGVPM